MSYTQSQYVVMAWEAYAVDWICEVNQTSVFESSFFLNAIRFMCDVGVCMTILLYDHIITFGQEVATMWSSRWSVPKVLFLLNRYLVVAILVFNGLASSQTHLSNKLRILLAVASMYNYNHKYNCRRDTGGSCMGRRDNKIALTVAMTLYIFGIGVLVGLTIRDYVGEGPVEAVDDFAALPGCYARTVPDIIAGYWISPLIIESIFFAMITWRAVGWWKSRTPLPPTMVLLARDSAIYFLVIFVLLIVNLFVFEYGPPFLSSMMVTPSNTAGCIAGSRMLLNIRSLAHEEDESHHDAGDYELSRMFFKSRKFRTRGSGSGGGRSVGWSSSGDETTTTKGTVGLRTVDVVAGSTEPS
ncbi:hypothetical protein C8Q75DRAFT_801484 [Abortiporus biennis]|nr:hypothetical protein C8Q75DRAFT_801484 [Abortiporus biennis]